MNEQDLSEFLTWRNGFSLSDDGVAAYKALKALETIRFELATRTEGYLGRIQIAVDQAE